MPRQIYKPEEIVAKLRQVGSAEAAVQADHGFHPKACRPYRAKTTDEVEYPLRAPVLFSARLRMTSRRRVGLEVKAWPRCLHCRSSFEASADTRLPRLVHPSVSRL